MRLIRINHNKWFSTVLMTALVVLVGMNVFCEHPYHTNPNLRLLVGDTTTEYDDMHCSNPVVSPDGKVIYYLCVDADSLSPTLSIGAIYSINIDGTNSIKLLDGKFNALAISHDGNKLAIHPYISYATLEAESLIMIFNLATSETDSYPMRKKLIRDIEFTENDDYVYYSVDIYTPTLPKTEIYRLNLSDSTNELLQTIDCYLGFDLYKNNSLYIDSVMAFPQIDPVQETYVIGNSAGSFGFELLMQNTGNDTLIKLPDSLIPYVEGAIGYPYWFSDGNTIVFSAQPYKEGSGAPSEIWILENVFEQIEE